MGRTQCGTKTGTWSTMHEYPYSMLALTAYLYYIMILFNPVKFVMNLLLPRLTSLILDVPPLFMVMLFFIATGCNDPSASAASLSSRCTVSSPTVNSSRREISIHRESSLSRSSFPRSWPSWDWLQPYDPDLFLRAEKKHKMGSKAGDIDRKSPSGRPAEPRVQESSSGMQSSNSVVAGPCEGSTCNRRSKGQAPLDEPAQQPTPRSDPIFQIQRSSGENETSKEIHDHGMKKKVVDPLQQALEGTSLVIKRSRGETSALTCGESKGTATEFEIQVTAAEMAEPQSTISNSASGGGPVHAEPCDGLANINARPDPETVSQASQEVSVGDPGHYENGMINRVEDPSNGLTSNSQLISVGSLNDWSQLLCGEDEKSEDNFGDGRGYASEIFFPITSEDMNRPSPRTEVNQDRVNFSSTFKNFIGLTAGPCTAAEPLPVMKDPDCSCFNELGSPPLETLREVSHLYSFKHMTLDEKTEEKIYWVMREGRCGEVESWRKALLSKAPPEKNLFQGLTLSASIPHASVDNDTYKPSAPPFDPLLFYENFIQDGVFTNHSLFFKTYKPFITDEGNVFLFNCLEPESYLLYHCGNCYCNAY